jgi:hypothetical protein
MNLPASLRSGNRPLGRGLAGRTIMDSVAGWRGIGIVLVNSGKPPGIQEKL